MEMKEIILEAIATHQSLDNKLHLMEEFERFFNELESSKKAKELFLEEFKHEYAWQTLNVKSGGQWQKGALRGFEHTKEIFDKHFKL